MSWKSVWMFRFILRQPSLIWQSFTLNNIKFYKNRDNNNITKDTDNKQTVRPLYKPNFFKIFSLCEVTLARQWDSPVNLLFPILGKKKTTKKIVSSFLLFEEKRKVSVRQKPYSPKAPQPCRTETFCK